MVHGAKVAEGVKKQMDALHRENCQSNIVIRRIAPYEWPIYKEIRLESLKDSPEAFSTRYEDARKRSEKTWEDQVTGLAGSENECCYLVFEDEECIGLAAIYRNKENREEAEICQVYLKKEKRGRKIGNRLMKQILAWVKKTDVKTVKAVISNGNRKVIRFYEKCGFIVSEDNDNNIEMTKNVNN